MSSLPSWAQWSIIAAGVLVSPVLAFLMALVVAAQLGLLKDAGPLASLVTIVFCIVYLQVRRRRAAPTGQRLSGT